MKAFPRQETNAIREIRCKETGTRLWQPNNAYHRRRVAHVHVNHARLAAEQTSHAHIGQQLNKLQTTSISSKYFDRGKRTTQNEISRNPKNDYGKNADPSRGFNEMKIESTVARLKEKQPHYRTERKEEQRQTS